MRRDNSKELLSIEKAIKKPMKRFNSKSSNNSDYIPADDELEDGIVERGS